MLRWREAGLAARATTNVGPDNDIRDLEALKASMSAFGHADGEAYADVVGGGNRHGAVDGSRDDAPIFAHSTAQLSRELADQHIF